MKKSEEKKSLWTVKLTAEIVVYATGYIAAQNEAAEAWRSESIDNVNTGTPRPLAPMQPLPKGWDETALPFGAEGDRSIGQIRAAEAAESAAEAAASAATDPPRDRLVEARIGYIATHAGRSFGFIYTNWRNETAHRMATLDLTTLRYGTTEGYHPEPSWLIDGVCLDKGAPRTFDVARMTDLCVTVPR